MSSRLMIEGAFSCIRGFEIVPAIGMVEDARGGGQKRQECRFPEVRRVGVRVARLCPLSSVFCPPASVLCPLSSVLKGDEDKGQRTKDKGWRTLDIGTENRKTIEKHLALWRFIAVNCINSGRPSFVL